MGSVSFTVGLEMPAATSGLRAHKGRIVFRPAITPRLARHADTAMSPIRGIHSFGTAIGPRIGFSSAGNLL
jgi:hypothetical protein